MNPQHICQLCEFREKDFKPPRCACTVDGDDIGIHAFKRFCPKGFYDALAGETPAEVEERLKQQGYNPQTSPEGHKGGCCAPPPSE
jgi:hypothetical protein